jgi:uncharacterized protein YcfL
MKKLFFLSFVSFIAGCGVSSKPARVVETQPVVVETVVEQPAVETQQSVVVAEQQPEELTPDLENSAYKAGYKRGYKSFMKQMGLESAEDSKEISYTSNVEDKSISQTEEQTKEYQDIMMKGYVDGYHKAGESSEYKYCPRN